MSVSKSICWGRCLTHCLAVWLVTEQSLAVSTVEWRTVRCADVYHLCSHHSYGGKSGNKIVIKWQCNSDNNSAIILHIDDNFTSRRNHALTILRCVFCDNICGSKIASCGSVSVCVLCCMLYTSHYTCLHVNLHCVSWGQAIYQGHHHHTNCIWAYSD